jgi:hypothetical protein
MSDDKLNLTPVILMDDDRTNLTLVVDNLSTKLLQDEREMFNELWDKIVGRCRVWSRDEGN